MGRWRRLKGHVGGFAHSANPKDYLIKTSSNWLVVQKNSLLQGTVRGEEREVKGYLSQIITIHFS